MLTLGQLADRLKELQEAEAAVAAAELSLRHGGNALTMVGKQDTLERAVRELHRIRDEPVQLEN